MQLLHIDNYTPFEWFAFEKMAPGKRLFDIVIVKAAYSLVLDGAYYQIAPFSDEILPVIHMSDQSYGFNAGAYASIQFAGDAVIYKPGTDFFIVGDAIGPEAKTATWAAEINIKTKEKKYTQMILLHGKRHWQWRFTRGWHLSDSQPTEDVPLRYELTFGGSYQKKDTWNRYADNPVGLGHIPVHRMDKEIFYPAAQIELAKDRLKEVDRPIKVPGLGPIPRTWDARKKLAGTYDAEWKAELKRNRTADYPADFKPEFFQSAHPHWVCMPYLQGDDVIQVLGFTGEKHASIKLPQLELFLSGMATQGDLPAEKMNLDTVEVDIGNMQINLVWRIALDQIMEVNSARIDVTGNLF